MERLCQLVHEIHRRRPEGSDMHSVRLTLGLAIAAVPASGQTRDFRPVTDAVLQAPSDSDWLQWRRTLPD